MMSRGSCRRVGLGVLILCECFSFYFIGLYAVGV